MGVHDFSFPFTGCPRPDCSSSTGASFTHLNTTDNAGPPQLRGSSAGESSPVTASAPKVVHGLVVHGLVVHGLVVHGLVVRGAWTSLGHVVQWCVDLSWAPMRGAGAWISIG